MIYIYICGREKSSQWGRALFSGGSMLDKLCVKGPAPAAPFAHQLHSFFPYTNTSRQTDRQTEVLIISRHNLRAREPTDRQTDIQTDQCPLTEGFLHILP